MFASAPFRHDRHCLGLDVGVGMARRMVAILLWIVKIVVGVVVVRSSCGVGMNQSDDDGYNNDAWEYNQPRYSAHHERGRGGGGAARMVVGCRLNSTLVILLISSNIYCSCGYCCLGEE